MTSQTEPQFSFRISRQPAGYAYGVKQPSVTMDVTLQCPDKFDVETAMPTLARIFKMTEDDLPVVRNLAKPTPPAPLLEYLRFSCGVARQIMQESGLPLFATEVLHRVEARDDNPTLLDIRLRVPVLDATPREYIATGYSRAFALMWAFTAETFDAEAFKTAADALHESFVGPVRTRMYHGLSTVPMFQEAYRREIPVTYLGHGTYQLGTGAYSRVINRSSTDRDSSFGADVTRNKVRCQTLLRSIGAPVPESYSVSDADGAVQAAKQIGYPVVVKPADLDRSKGVFVGLTTDDAVRTAYESARELSANILVQRQIPGYCARLVTFDGEFVFAYSRLPSGVEGDGTQTIRALVDAFNRDLTDSARHLQKYRIPFDDEAIAHLATQGLQPDTVLDEGQRAFVRPANVPDYAGFNEVNTDKIHPENVALAKRLAALVRLESVGIDLISPDPTRPWYENGAAITELNFRPQIGANTAPKNLALMFPEGAPSAIPVECYVGGDAAWRAALRRREVLSSQGVAAVLTSHNKTIGTNGAPYHTAGLGGLHDRCVAMLRNPEIEALLVAVQSDAFLKSGPPFKGNVTVVRIDNSVSITSDPSKRLSDAGLSRLLKALNGM